jgi:hypothetical protein
MCIQFVNRYHKGMEHIWNGKFMLKLESQAKKITKFDNVT